jgi:predicted transcriptional regulator
MCPAVCLVPYPGRPVLEVLPEFVATASTHQTREQRARLLSFCAEQYAAGRSLRELAELTGRTQSAVHRALDQAGVERRGRGARPVNV